MIYDVVLPSSDNVAKLGSIIHGSGVVARKHSEYDDLLILDFEGNKYGFANVKTFADKVCVAASRAQSNYPTVARLIVQSGDVTRIGHYDDNGTINGECVVLNDAGREALPSWIACPPSELRHELVRSG